MLLKTPQKIKKLPVPAMKNETNTFLCSESNKINFDLPSRSRYTHNYDYNRLLKLIK